MSEPGPLDASRFLNILIITYLSILKLEIESELLKKFLNEIEDLSPVRPMWDVFNLSLEFFFLSNNFNTNNNNTSS